MVRVRFQELYIILPYYWGAVFTVVAMVTEQTHFLLTTVQSCVKERTQSLTRGSSERLRGGWGDTEARVCLCIQWDYNYYSTPYVLQCILRVILTLYNDCEYSVCVTVCVFTVHIPMGGMLWLLLTLFGIQCKEHKHISTSAYCLLDRHPPSLHAYKLIQFQSIE